MARLWADHNGRETGACWRVIFPAHKRIIVTSMGWHEWNLAENRLPTGAELDAAAPSHPVLARRGGHLAIASTAALAAAGVARPFNLLDR
jgi:predicted amidohydrolase YtcJ